jgi:hypothetical protein
MGMIVAESRRRFMRSGGRFRAAKLPRLPSTADEGMGCRNPLNRGFVTETSLPLGESR